MKIQNSTYSPSFSAGLTRSMQLEIAHCDPYKISRTLKKNDIISSFKGNKTVAWCCLKCVEIINLMNQGFDTNLSLPKAIFVEDFNKLAIKGKNASGACNIFPACMYENSNQLVPEKTIFFNEYSDDNYSKGNYYWDNIDENADMFKELNLAPTNFFLDIFLHEFSHVIHDGHLIEKFGIENLMKKVVETLNNKNKLAFDKKYFWLICRNICQYGTNSPFEAIACDLTNRIIKNINKNTLIPKTNFIENSPYRKHSIKNDLVISITEGEYNRAIRRFWNGKFK